MVEVLHLGSLVPAALGLCCAVGDRRERTAVAWVPALVMLVAMTDVAGGIGLVAPIAWAALLTALAVWPALALRMSRARLTPGGRGHPALTETAMALHRSFSLVVMAGLMTVMGSSGAAPAGHAHSTDVTAVVVLGAAVLVGFTGWLVVRLIRNTVRPAGLVARLKPLEVFSMAASVGLMALAVVVR